MKKFEIWRKGYSDMFNCPWSLYVGEAYGSNFEDAFRTFMKTKDWPSWVYNKENNTILGDTLVIKLKSIDHKIS